jgi:hypothetical protein
LPRASNADALADPSAVIKGGRHKRRSAGNGGVKPRNGFFGARILRRVALLFSSSIAFAVTAAEMTVSTSAPVKRPPDAQLFGVRE